MHLLVLGFLLSWLTSQPAFCGTWISSDPGLNLAQTGFTPPTVYSGSNFFGNYRTYAVWNESFPLSTSVSLGFTNPGSTIDGSFCFMPIIGSTFVNTSLFFTAFTPPSECFGFFWTLTAQTSSVVREGYYNAYEAYSTPSLTSYNIQTFGNGVVRTSINGIQTGSFTLPADFSRYMVYVTFSCYSGIQAVSLNSTLAVAPSVQTPAALGVAFGGTIPDQYMQGGLCVTCANAQFLPRSARLNSSNLAFFEAGYEITLTNLDFIQVTFAVPMTITQIALQGMGSSFAPISLSAKFSMPSLFNISYSTTVTPFNIAVGNIAAPGTFTYVGTYDSTFNTTNVANYLYNNGQGPISYVNISNPLLVGVTSIQLSVVTCTAVPCFVKLEYYGYPSAPTYAPLGMASGSILNSQISGSTCPFCDFGEYLPAFGRLNNPASSVLQQAYIGNVNGYMQVVFTNFTTIVSITMQGIQQPSSIVYSVLSFTLSYSPDYGVTFINLPDIYYTAQYSEQPSVFLATRTIVLVAPITVTQIRITAVSCFNACAYRLEFNGITVVSPTYYPTPTSQPPTTTAAPTTAVPTTAVPTTAAPTVNPTLYSSPAVSTQFRITVNNPAAFANATNVAVVTSVLAQALNVQTPTILNVRLSLSQISQSVVNTGMKLESAGLVYIAFDSIPTTAIKFYLNSASTVSNTLLAFGFILDTTYPITLVATTLAPTTAAPTASATTAAPTTNVTVAPTLVAPLNISSFAAVYTEFRVLVNSPSAIIATAGINATLTHIIALALAIPDNRIVKLSLSTQPITLVDQANKNKMMTATSPLYISFEIIYLGGTGSSSGEMYVSFYFQAIDENSLLSQLLTISGILLDTTYLPPLLQGAAVPTVVPSASADTTSTSSTDLWGISWWEAALGLAGFAIVLTAMVWCVIKRNEIWDGGVRDTLSDAVEKTASAVSDTFTGDGADD